MSKIKVSFRGKLIKLISESDSCPGDLVEGETSECETGITCDECVEAFIDRITVKEPAAWAASRARESMAAEILEKHRSGNDSLEAYDDILRMAMEILGRNT
jgi:hypothetical protein